MPVVDDEVPEWKKELIRKRQLWRRSGGWSVPPVAASKTGLTSGVGRTSEEAVTERLGDDVVTTRGFAGSVENLRSFGSVSELKTKFQSEDDAFEPMTRARSEENILDVQVVSDARRRSSTSQYPSYHQNGAEALNKTVKTVPKMEDFLKKYRKPTRKSVVEQNGMDSPKTEVDSPKPSTKTTRRKRSETVYFLDMNQNELPPPNTVRQTVKSFEEPVTSESNSAKTDVDDVTSSTDVRAWDVVRKFEEKIQSSAAPPKPPRANRRRDVRPAKPPKPSIVGGNSRKTTKHVSFETDVVGVQNDGASDVGSVQNDLRTVNINANQPLII